MNSIYFWKTIIPLGIGTLLIRMSFIFLSNKLEIKDETKKLFTYIPVAVLPALFTPMVFYYEGSNEIVFGFERVIAFIFAVGVSYYSKNILITIVSGLLFLFFLNNIL